METAQKTLDDLIATREEVKVKVEVTHFLLFSCYYLLCRFQGWNWYPKSTPACGYVVNVLTCSRKVKEKTERKWLIGSTHCLEICKCLSGDWAVGQGEAGSAHEIEWEGIQDGVALTVQEKFNWSKFFQLLVMQYSGIFNHTFFCRYLSIYIYTIYIYILSAKTSTYRLSHRSISTAG